MHVVKLPRDEKGPPPWHSEQSGMGKGQDGLEQTPRESVSLEAVVVNWLGPSLFHILYTFDACFIWFFNVFFKGSHYVAQVALRLSIPHPCIPEIPGMCHLSGMFYTLYAWYPTKANILKVEASVRESRPQMVHLPYLMNPDSNHAILKG